MLYTTTLLSLLSVVSLVLSQAPPTTQCPIVFDGRWGQYLQPAQLDDSENSQIPYRQDLYKNETQKWATVIQLPQYPPNDGVYSRFDFYRFRPVELTVNDKSQYGNPTNWRRANLAFKGDLANGNGNGFKGVRTFHFSTRWSAARPLLLNKYGYDVAWHESDNGLNHFTLKAGNVAGLRYTSPETFGFYDKSGTRVWSLPVDKTTYQNWAITTEPAKNWLSLYYSAGQGQLTKVWSGAADLGGTTGTYQLGLLKKDLAVGQTAQTGVTEGLIFRDVWVEDSANNCVSL